jgi:hypothetical protein
MGKWTPKTSLRFQFGIELRILKTTAASGEAAELEAELAEAAEFDAVFEFSWVNDQSP